ncbi:MAG TPA: hypothetical protein VFA74_18545 [Terriglobales bacterium]|nr:hypothetical protein [Terriglobales bacterium]
MADPLYLSLWFPNFELREMLPRALAVLQQFPFSPQRSGITYIVVQPVSWNEPTVFEQRFSPGVSPEEAVLMASDLLHEDHAYVFEAYWDLWTAASDGQSSLQPSLVRFQVHGGEFDESVYEQQGHILVDFGLDSHFLQDQIQLTPEAEERVKANVQKLVDFINKVQQHSGANARLLWSDSEENFAQKLIGRLQKVQ